MKKFIEFINEEESVKQKILNLFKTKDVGNIELGLMLAKGQKVKFKKGEIDLSYASLSGIDLRDMDLRIFIFSIFLHKRLSLGVTLNKANLRGANLSNMELRFIMMRNTDLRDADLSGADLSVASLRGDRKSVV